MLIKTCPWMEIWTSGTSSFFNRLNVISNNGIYASGNVVANDLTAMGRAFVNKQLFLYQDVTTSASIECKNLTVNGFSQLISKIM